MSMIFTPWGEPNRVFEVAPGIRWYETACHGGFYLSPERNAEVPQDLKESTHESFGLYGWYEEDCDALIIFDLFPELEPKLLSLIFP